MNLFWLKLSVRIILFSLSAFVTTKFYHMFKDSRLTKQQAHEENILKYPTMFFILTLLSFILFLSILIITISKPNESVSWFTHLVFSLFLCLSLLGIISYIKQKHKVSKAGILVGSLWGSKKFISWDEISHIEISFKKNGITITTEKKSSFTFSFMLIGLPRLSEMIIKNYPEDQLSPEVIHFLEETSQGNLPDPY